MIEAVGRDKEVDSRKSPVRPVGLGLNEARGNTRMQI